MIVNKMKIYVGWKHAKGTVLIPNFQGGLVLMLPCQAVIFMTVILLFHSSFRIRGR